MTTPQNNINILLGLAVRNERKARNWSQETLAWQAHLNRNYVSLIERGERSPTLNTLNQLCTAFSIPISQLIAAMEALDDTWHSDSNDS